MDVFLESHFAQHSLSLFHLYLESEQYAYVSKLRMNFHADRSRERSIQPD